MNSDEDIDLYHQIANCMIQALPPEWQTAWIDFEFEPNVVTATGQCRVAEDGESQALVFVVDRAINHLIHKLHSRAAKKVGNTWKAARFLLHEDGTFKLNIAYSDERQ